MATNLCGSAYKEGGLVCTLPTGHSGDHRELPYDATWADKHSTKPTARMVLQDARCGVHARSLPCFECEAADGPVRARLEQAPQHAPAPGPKPATRGKARQVAAALPTARVAAPIDEQLADILVLCGDFITKAKAAGINNPKDAEALLGVVRALGMTHELQRKVRAELEAEFGSEDDVALAARLQATQAALAGGVKP